jgi:hypothetical protein
MSPITHFLVGWCTCERAVASRRDKAIVALAGVAPDLDGLPIVVDFTTRALGLPETNYYWATHHVYGHGLPAVLAIMALAAALADRKARVALLVCLTAHLHFACDLLGSRGSGPDDQWGIAYFSPFSMDNEIFWSGQWQLVGWQNMLITAVLIAIALWRAATLGYSPVALVSARGDAALVAVLRKWRGIAS